MKYVRGYVSSIIPNSKTLIIELCGCKHACQNCGNRFRQVEEGQPLDERLDMIIGMFEKTVDVVCFVGGENDMQTLQSMFTFIHKKGLKTALSTAYPETSMVNRRLTEVLDYILIGRCDTKQKILKKDYSPFGDIEDWIEIKGQETSNYVDT